MNLSGRSQVQSQHLNHHHLSLFIFNRVFNLSKPILVTTFWATIDLVHLLDNAQHPHLGRNILYELNKVNWSHNESVKLLKAKIKQMDLINYLDYHCNSSVALLY